MSKATAAKKAAQLGMPLGTAQGRLLKQLLFRMAQELERDVCFQCGEKINSVEEFSIEHKQPWLDVSVELYWDLANIAFSHRVCNIRAARRDVPRLREQLNRIRVDRVKGAPEGQAWCYGHKDFLPKDQFNANSWFRSGVQRFCKECRSNGTGR
jgi:hypothetical protein